MIQVSDIGRRERLIVARLPTQLEILIGTGESPAQQYDLLRRARCLSPTALAARASVIDLLDRTARALTKPAPSSSPPEPMMLGGPTIAERLLDALYAADFLDRDRSAHFQIPARDPELVGPFVGRMRATNDAPLEPWPVGFVEDSFSDDIACLHCGQRLPSHAVYCGGCGFRLR